MRTRAKTAVAAVGIVAVTLVGSDAMTYAGTGDSLILGKLNKSAKTTHVTNTGKGPALSLHAKGKRPALAVDSNAKIVRLNADRVDGKDAAALQNNVRVYTAGQGTAGDGSMTLALPQFANGRYHVGYEVYMLGAYGTISDPTIARCYVYEQGTSDNKGAAVTSTTAEGFAPGLSGNGLIIKDADPWYLSCEAYQLNVGADDWFIPSNFPIRVTLTRIDRTIGGELARDAARTTAHAPLPIRP
jgi:hypothetical protein